EPVCLFDDRHGFAGELLRFDELATLGKDARPHPTQARMWLKVVRRRKLLDFGCNRLGLVQPPRMEKSLGEVAAGGRTPTHLTQLTAQVVGTADDVQGSRRVAGQQKDFRPL